MKTETTSEASLKPQRPESNANVETNPSIASGSFTANAALPETHKIKFEEIQGNCFGGFLKDHQVNILFKLDEKKLDKIRSSLGPTDEGDAAFSTGIFSHVKHSSSKAVIAFNEQFKALRRAGIAEGTIVGTWTNIVFTNTGLSKLGKDPKPLGKAFNARMEGRAAVIGDVDATFDSSKGVVENGLNHWNKGMDVIVPWEEVDGMLILASDDPSELDRLQKTSRLAQTLAKLEADNSGVAILGIIRGETRVDDVGHEHFGFKDGVSQPGIRGVDSSDDPLHNADQGNPGQDLLHPGEFVIGYPTQIGKAGIDEDGQEIDGPNPFPGPNSSIPNAEWAKNGSFLVFRRLAQDVKGFRESVSRQAADLGLTTDLMGAKLVGRYRSGAPLEALKFQSGTGGYQPPEIDPGVARPALANSDALNNNFEYGEDPKGDIVPLASHIRKAYPRDQVPKFENGKVIANVNGSPISGSEAESRTQTHRLLRRGIPFGKSLGLGEGGGDHDPRGLLFFAYQSSIERQFEFVQGVWVNDPKFPERATQTQPEAGQDPIITNNSASGAIRGCPFHALAAKAKCPMSFKHFVKTRGGGYFFSPSISMLSDLIAPTPVVTSP